jgi:hypothetical protein
VQFTTTENVVGASFTWPDSFNSGIGPGPSIITVTYHPSFRDAALKTIGHKQCDIRTSTYASATRITTVQGLEDVVRLQRSGSFHNKSYVLGTNDCQDYARDLVDRLNSIWVGIYRP